MTANLNGIFISINLPCVELRRNLWDYLFPALRALPREQADLLWACLDAFVQADYDRTPCTEVGQVVCPGKRWYNFDTYKTGTVTTNKYAERRVLRGWSHQGVPIEENESLRSHLDAPPGVVLWIPDGRDRYRWVWANYLESYRLSLTSGAGHIIWDQANGDGRMWSTFKDLYYTISPSFVDDAAK